MTSTFVLLNSGLNMDAGKILTEGVDQGEPLLAKVQKTTNEIRELDVKCTEITKNIRMRVVAHLKASKNMTTEQRKHVNIADEIDAMYDEAEKLARKKMDLANALYNSIDQDIVIMDKTTKKPESGTRRRRDDVAGMNVPVVEMLVDPNEPVYCTCRKVSFGEMVCCDNPDCEVEWFHFQCVGMAEGPPPQVKWYCEFCRTAFKHVNNQWNYDANEPPKKK